MASRRKKKTNDPLITDAMGAFRSIEEHETQWRIDWRDDLEFYALQQWPAKLKAQREAAGKACLVMDEVSQYVRQVTNEIRLNPPSIHARPVDDKADIEVAEAIQGLFRHIEEVSRARNAYKTAAEWAAVTGRGFFRVYAKQSDEGRNLYDPMVGRIANAMSVYFDEFSVEMDGSDATEAFIIEHRRPSRFKIEYPGCDTAGFAGNANASDYDDWLTSDSIRVAEWHRKEKRGERTKVKTESGEMTEEQALIVKPENFRQVKETEWVNVVRKITALEVLEENEFFSEYIGVVPVYGNERFTSDSRELFGLIRPSKDPQRLNNYLASNMAEAAVKQAKSPWLAAIEAIEGHETEWSNAGEESNYLPYNGVDQEGNQIAMPSRTDIDSRLPGYGQLIELGSRRVQASVGMYQAAVGAPSNEKSGKAIQERQDESDVSTYHYTDNLSQSIQHAGRIIMQMIPHVYDVPRMQRILGEDGTADNVRVDPNSAKPYDQIKTGAGGVLKVINPHIGKYDVIVTIGPSFSSKRQEAATIIGDLVTSDPGLMQMFGDLWLKNMDFPGAQEMAKRAKKLVPPEVADKDEDEAKMPEEVERGLTQLVQVLQQRDQQIDAKMEQISEASTQAKKDINQARVDRAQAQTERANVKAERAALQTEITKLQAQARDLIAQKGQLEADISAKQNDLRKDQTNTELHIENAALKAQSRVDKSQPRAE